MGKSTCLRSNEINFLKIKSPDNCGDNCGNCGKHMLNNELVTIWPTITGSMCLCQNCLFQLYVKLDQMFEGGIDGDNWYTNINGFKFPIIKLYDDDNDFKPTRIKWENNNRGKQNE